MNLIQSRRLAIGRGRSIIWSSSKGFDRMFSSQKQVCTAPTSASCTRSSVNEGIPEGCAELKSSRRRRFTIARGCGRIWNYSGKIEEIGPVMLPASSTLQRQHMDSDEWHSEVEPIRCTWLVVVAAAGILLEIPNRSVTFSFRLWYRSSVNEQHPIKGVSNQSMQNEEAL